MGRGGRAWEWLVVGNDGKEPKYTITCCTRFKLFVSAGVRKERMWCELFDNAVGPTGGDDTSWTGDCWKQCASLCAEVVVAACASLWLCVCFDRAPTRTAYFWHCRKCD